MKKLVIGLLFAAGIAGAACMGPFCWDDTGASIAGQLISGNGNGNPSASSTTINGIVAKAAGQDIVCNTCTYGTGAFAVCMSTAANSTSWVIQSSTTRACN